MKHLSLFLFILLVLPANGKPVDFAEVLAARKVCNEKRGILISQGSVVACFDPARTPINDYFSFAKGHAKPEKEDFDLLTQKNIRFYRHFREFSKLTVCNYTRNEIYTDFASSMDIFGEANAKEKFDKMRLQPFECKTDGTHMFALFADRKTAEMAVGLCATPDGRPYYDDRKNNDDKKLLPPAESAERKKNSHNNTTR